MRTIYIIAVCGIFLVFPYIARSQCTCSGGAPANVLTYHFTLLPSSLAVNPIVFPKFDASLGTLACVVFEDTISAISTTTVLNQSPQDEQYRFRLTVSNNITGPGISVFESFDTMYGPDSLMASGSPGDWIVYGPDTVFQNETHRRTNTTNLAPYLGAGNVTFFYNISGGLISLQGGLNFTQTIQTFVFGEFSLSYYWCPNIILPRGFRNFAAKKGNDNIQLSWNIEDEELGNQYFIEYSKDAINFKTVGQVTASRNNLAAYKYQINTGADETGYRSIRIKQITVSGETRYSTIRTVLLEQPGTLGITVGPNPAVRSINIQFDQPASGNYEIALVNMAGQPVFKKEYKLRNQYQLTVDWPVQPPGGIYFLQTRNRQTNISRMTKLVIRN